MFEALGLLGARGSFTELMQSCAMVPELKSRAALDTGDYSLKAARIGVPKCSGTGVCSCVLPTPPAMHGQVAALAQVFSRTHPRATPLCNPPLLRRLSYALCRGL